VFGSPVERYLAGRGLILPEDAERWLGFVPALDYWQGDEAGGRPRWIGAWPAMVAAVQGPDGRFSALHQTWLAAIDDRVIKTPPARLAGGPARKVLGLWGGGAIRIDSVVGDELGLAEGIETALAVRQMTGRALWAVGAVGRFAAVAIPDTVRRVVLAGDGDEPDLADRIAAGEMPVTPAGRALARATGRFRLAGLTVRLTVPKLIDGARKDWDDVLLARGDHAHLQIASRTELTM
jgi:putative DNA primase/helicase